MKCIKPMEHRPEFEGKLNCKHCEREQEKEREGKIRHQCLLLGVAVMSDIRLVVREELERVGLKKEDSE